jgi:hypothetical protein
VLEDPVVRAVITQTAMDVVQVAEKAAEQITQEEEAEVEKAVAASVTKRKVQISTIIDTSEIIDPSPIVEPVTGSGNPTLWTPGDPQ